MAVPEACQRSTHQARRAACTSRLRELELPPVPRLDEAPVLAQGALGRRRDFLEERPYIPHAALLDAAPAAIDELCRTTIGSPHRRQLLGGMHDGLWTCGGRSSRPCRSWTSSAAPTGPTGP